jgi:hypothetical protein
MFGTFLYFLLRISVSVLIKLCIFFLPPYFVACSHLSDRCEESARPVRPHLCGAYGDSGGL